MQQQKKNIYLKKGKQSLILNQSHRKSPFQIQPNNIRKNSSTLTKKKSTQNQNFSLNKTHKSKSRLGSSLSTLIKDQKTHKNASRKRLLSDYSSKQLNARCSKSVEKKQKKYIFNPFKNQNPRNTLTIKPRNSVSSLHSKSYSNQTVIKNATGSKNNFAFNKSSSNSQFCKIKKKKHDYIKSFNKTSCFQKSLSMGFNSMGHELNQTLQQNRLQNTRLQNSSKVNLNQSKLLRCNNEQISKLKLQTQKNLYQINLNSKSLFKKLKSPEKVKLALITNGYQKIVTELFGVLNRTISLPECDISRINTHKTKQTADKQNESKQFQSPNIFSKPSNFKILSKQNIFQVHDSCQPSQNLSQHWDSYLDCVPSQKSQKNNRNNLLVKSTNSTMSKIKNLNLKDIKKQQIQEYHQEFMNLKDGFSQSWKRQLNQQKKF